MSAPKKARIEIICVIEDEPEYNEIISRILQGEGYGVISFPSAQVFLESETAELQTYDLIVTDLSMPGISGLDLCREIRTKACDERMPIILISGDSSFGKDEAINAGADDLLAKPFRAAELLAKVASLLEIRAQSIERTQRLARFISPNVAKYVLSDARQGAIKPHRAVVTVMFIDLRGFTAFGETAHPEDVMEVLNRYYKAVGTIGLKYKATLGNFAGDGIMLFLNDPEPVERHQETGVKMALDIRDSLIPQRDLWQVKGFNIDFGIGLAEGPATMGGIGFDQFWQYSVIGSVANFASRMCHVATNGQILVSHRFLTRMFGEGFEIESIGAVPLKGIQRPVDTYNVIGIKKLK